MCTIVVLHRVCPDHPLVVGANRDEFYAREATPPTVLADSPRVVGGRDCLQGGTWMGATRDGLFVGITNQRTHRFPGEALRSRGHVTLDALRTGSRRGVRDLIESVDARDYNSFNLIYGDATGVEVAYARREARSVEIAELPEGMHVLANDRMRSPEFPKAARIEGLVASHAHRPWAELRPHLEAALADHERPLTDALVPPPPGSPFTLELVRELQAVCIHTPRYGTRSSTVLALDEGGVASYRFADGPPCSQPFREYAGLF